MAGIIGEIAQKAQTLQGVRQNNMALQQAQELQQREAQGREALQAYYKSGGQDRDALINGIMNSPELANNVLSGIGIADKRQEEQAAADVARLWQTRSNPESFRGAVAQRIDAVMQRGGNPSDTVQLGMIYEKDPMEAETQLKGIAAALEAKGYKTGVFDVAAGTEPMTAFQAASTDLRRQELELKRFDAMQKQLESQLARETNDLKKQELQQRISENEMKMQDAKKQKETAARERDADLNQAYFGIDNMLNTVARVKSAPKLDSVVGSIQGRMDAYIDDEAAATIRLIENLGSQAFMAMIPSLKGMGALSNAEGDKLAASLQNLSRVTSEKAFRETLNEVERLMNKSRKFISQRYGKPETTPDVPAAERAEQDILSEYGL